MANDAKWMMCVVSVMLVSLACVVGEILQVVVALEGGVGVEAAKCGRREGMRICRWALHARRRRLR